MNKYIVLGLWLGLSGPVWAAPPVGSVQYQALPNCVDTSGNHLNYTLSTGVLSCGTSGGSGTVNSGVSGEIAYYSSTGTTVSGNAASSLSNGIFSLGISGFAGEILLNNSAGTPSWVLSPPAGSNTALWIGPTALASAQSVVSIDASGQLYVDAPGTGLIFSGSTLNVNAGNVPGNSGSGTSSVGSLGEVMTSSAINCSTITGLTSGTTAVVTTIALTAGEWLVYGEGGVTLATTTVLTNLQVGIGNTTTMPSIGALGAIQVPVNYTASGTTAFTQNIVANFTPNTTTTINLLVNASFTVSTAGVCGRIRAFRVG